MGSKNTKKRSDKIFLEDFPREFVTATSRHGIGINKLLEVAKGKTIIVSDVKFAD